MAFIKGAIPWNKGIKYTKEFKEKYLNEEWREKIRNSIYHRNMKGENHPMFGLHRFGKDAPMWGKHHTKDTKNRMSIVHQKGEKIFRLEGNIYKDFNQWRKTKRHKLGISKKYREECLRGISKTKEYKKLQRQKRKALLKGGGELTIQTIQLVYEDNIKQYGTLTCYLCLNPILFGKDHLEHKIPLSRGGTNIKNNLDVACQKCNNKKYNKTEQEFREEINSYGTLSK